MIERWSRERVGAWYDGQPWMLGFNYLPRTAVNWTELWQAETFDLATIEQELDWAQRTGFNALRTNLQYLVWRHDAAGTVARLDRFLGAAARRGLRTMLCLFDDCAFSGREPYLGPQDPPVPDLHNSGAAASPGRAVVRDRAAWPALEHYVKDVVGSFRDDARLVAFDLYNEPGNEMVFTYKPETHSDGPLAPHSVELAEHAFRWAREVGATQPLTTGVWDRSMDPALARRLLDASDFVSFHDYLPLANVTEQIAALRAEGRPIVCTEWLARGLRSRPETHLPFFARERVGAFHWVWSTTVPRPTARGRAWSASFPTTVSGTTIFCTRTERPTTSARSRCSAPWARRSAPPRRFQLPTDRGRSHRSERPADLPRIEEERGEP